MDENKVISNDKAIIWHPFSSLKTERDPVEIVSGKGAWLEDKEGNKYLDAISSWWVTLHGHSNPYIADKVFEQLKTLEHVIFADFTHEPAVSLAKRLLALLPQNMERVFYSDNGSTSVEVALKMSTQYWANKGQKRSKFIALDEAYHGDTFGAMSVSDRGAFNSPFEDQLFPVDFLPFPSKENMSACIAKLESLLEQDEHAAFIFEPLIQGTAGMRMYEPEDLDELIRICQDKGLLCIADEVMTGFGRTGKMFAIDYLQSKPDIVCVSKAITGGTMALGLTVASEKVVQVFNSIDKDKTLFHGHSYTANPIACSAALASLDLVAKDSFFENIKRIEAQHQLFLAEIKGHESVRVARTKGIVFALEIKHESTSYFNELRDVLYNYYLEHKILLRPLGNVVYILPPLCMSNDELRSIYNIIESSLNKALWKVPQQLN